MKKIIVTTLCVFSAIFMVSCGSTGKNLAKMKGGAPKADPVHPQYHDWQGAAAGSSIPEWVGVVLSEGNEAEVCKALGKEPGKSVEKNGVWSYSGYRVWPIVVYGKNLDALKIAANNFGAQAKVAESIAQSVGEVSTQYIQAEGPDHEAEIVKASTEIINMVHSNLTLNGLEQVASYWTKYSMVNKKNQIIDADTYPQYMYCVVYGMDNSRYGKQLDEVMKPENLAKNAEESEYLRALADAFITTQRFPELVSGSATVELEVTNKKN